jgi:hypothetical protein
MNVSIDEIYQTIASNIKDSAILDNWERGVLNLKVFVDTVEYNLNFFSPDGEKKGAKFKRHPQMTEMILHLHGTTTEGGHNRWNRAVFKMWPNNKFEMEFIWDQELADEIERLNKE